MCRWGNTWRQRKFVNLGNRREVRHNWSLTSCPLQTEEQKETFKEDFKGMQSGSCVDILGRLLSVVSGDVWENLSIKFEWEMKAESEDKGKSQYFTRGKRGEQFSIELAVLLKMKVVYS